jgi:hypothetical protein
MEMAWRSWAAANAAILSADESATLRDRLLGEIADLQSQESETSWARGALAAKNRLTASDAKLLEDTFEKRLIGVLAVRKSGAFEPRSF